MALDSMPGCNRAAVLRPLLALAAAFLVTAPCCLGQERRRYETNGAYGIRLVPVQSKSAKDLALGQVLIASRDLADPNFAETAILLVHYDEKNVVGLVLNRRTDVPVSRLFQTEEAAKQRADRAYSGGPVERTVVMALLRSATALDNAQHISEDLYLVTSKERLEKAVAEGAGSSVFHLYLGYAGWTNAQLQMEVQAGAWYIFRADGEMVFDSKPESLWPRLIRKTEEKIAGISAARGVPSLLLAGLR